MLRDSKSSMLGPCWVAVLFYLRSQRIILRHNMQPQKQQIAAHPCRRLLCQLINLRLSSAQSGDANIHHENFTVSKYLSTMLSSMVAHLMLLYAASLKAYTCITLISCPGCWSRSFDNQPLQDCFIASMCGHLLCRDAARGVILAAIQCALAQISAAPLDAMFLGLLTFRQDVSMAWTPPGPLRHSKFPLAMADAFTCLMPGCRIFQ